MDTGLYNHIAAAFVRGVVADARNLDDAACIQLGLERGLKLHRFKRSELPRVQRVLGKLAGLAPTTLLDLGPGRGASLWPLVNAFPTLPISCIDVLPHRCELIETVRRGGIDALSVARGDGTTLPFAGQCADIVTILEVLEHQTEPETLAREAMRVAARAVVVSVPSKEDDNPDHVQLFNQSSLSDLLIRAGASRVSVEFVLNHMVALAMK